MVRQPNMQRIQSSQTCLAWERCRHLSSDCQVSSLKYRRLYRMKDVFDKPFSVLINPWKIVLHFSGDTPLHSASLWIMWQMGCVLAVGTVGGGHCCPEWRETWTLNSLYITQVLFKAIKNDFGSTFGRGVGRCGRALLSRDTVAMNNFSCAAGPPAASCIFQSFRCSDTFLQYHSRTAQYWHLFAAFSQRRWFF